MSGRQLTAVDSCYSCGSAERHSYAAENGFELVKCAGCGLLYAKERPDESVIDEAHKQGKHSGSHDFEITGTFDRRKLRVYESVLTELYGNSFDRPVRWFDIGCGHGEFLTALAAKYGPRVVASGSEPNEAKQTSARARGLAVGYTPLDEVHETFDTVSLLNVFSHLPDPREFLRSLRNLLTPDGELLIETGDTADLPADHHPRPYYLPDHLSFASEAIVTRLLDEAGFEVLGVAKRPYIVADVETVAKEMVKAVLPGRASRLGALLRGRSLGSTDMFIRARVAVGD